MTLKYFISTDYTKHRADMQLLWNNSYGHNNELLFDTYYQGNPFGKPNLGLCYDGPALVGQENFIQQKVSCAGQLYNGAIGIDTIVLPQYRLFYGIFGNLCKITIKELEKSYDILCANPNEESKKYYLKYFNWQKCAKVAVYKKIIKASGMKISNLLSYIYTGKLYKELTIKKVSIFNSDQLNPILESHQKKSSYVYFYKTAEFLNWKFIQNKHFKCNGYLIYFHNKIIGYCITSDSGEERSITDLLIHGDDPIIFKKVILSLCKMAKNDGMHRIAIHTTQDAWYKHILKKLFFIQREEYDFITYVFNKHIPNNGWIINSGDFDIF